MKKAVFTRNLISIIAAAALALGLVPSTAFATISNGADNSAGQGSAVSAPLRSDDEIESAINAMLEAGDYVEGEAIVCSLPDTDSTGKLGTQANEVNDLLDNAEGLSEVTAQQYAEATGESLAAAEAQNAMTAQSVDEQVEISLVRNESMSTAELLRVLLGNSRVLSAEPNYVMTFESDNENGSDGIATTDDASAASGASDAASASDTDANIADQTASSSTEARMNLIAQSGEDGSGASADLTKYQWFSDGVESTVPQYFDGTNPGVKAPNWNDESKTNATGVVVILDSGVDYTHPDLKNVMYSVSEELQAQLGCGEYGYAPAREDKTDPMDGLNHGTHCAGIVAAQWNDFGVSGIANGVKILAVSISESVTNSEFSYDTIIKGYDFIIRAAKAGVDIRAINRSLNCSPVNNANQTMIQAAGEMGIVTCVASGNENADLDTMCDDVSAAQPCEYLLRVNASKAQDDRAGFSCYGRYTTDVFAPGNAILSTVPSNQESKNRYFPQADEDPLYLETQFESALPNITGSADESDDAGLVVTGVSIGSIGVDGDGQSVKVDVKAHIEDSSLMYVDIPVGSLDDADVQDIMLALYTKDCEARTPSLSVLLEDGTYTEEDDGIIGMGASAPWGWSYVGTHFSQPSVLDQKFKRVTDASGRTCIRVRISTSLETSDATSGEVKDLELYLDQIAIGKVGNAGFLPYCYMNGTSMATPCVTACSAIVSSGIDGVSSAERAASTVRMLKGSVRQAEGYNGFCKQNGQVDLSLLGSTDSFVPVIESAQVQDGAITVAGAYFASGGTLLVGGKEVEVSSWTSDSIKGKWPSGVSSGLIPVIVKTNAGAESCRAFLLVAPDAETASAALYERDLNPINLQNDGTSVMGAPSSLVATDDGTLFAAVADVGGNGDTAVRYIMRSDDRGTTWTSVELPQGLKNTSLAAGDGKIFLWGATPIEDPVSIENWYLYSLDVSDNTLTKLRCLAQEDEVSGIGPIAYVNGNLLLADSYDDPEGEGPTKMRLRRFNDDYSLGESFLLDREYVAYGIYEGPKISVAGKSLYVCGFATTYDETPYAIYGLERVDVAADGSLSSTDLSAALDGLESGTEEFKVCMAACDQGVFLIGEDLQTLAPESAYATDTYLLKPGATSFEAYPKTLSYSMISYPASVVADGWLYAYGTSQYEDTSVFGRATELPAVEPEPEPEPEPESDNTPKVGESVVVGNYTYTVLSSTTASVKLSAKSKKSLTAAKIGTTVKLGKKTFKVTDIAAKGFAGAKKLKSVVIGKNVKKIHANAFNKCAKLKRVTGGARVTRIEKRAFAGCSKLKTFKVTSKKLAKIGASAFKGCKKLKKLSIAGTAKLTKGGVKKCLKGSAVNKVNVKNSKKVAYKKYFTKKNCGRNVTLK